MQRLLTAAVLTPLALLALFKMPGTGWFALVLLLVELAVWEYIKIVRNRAPHAPLYLLLVAVPVAALTFSASLFEGGELLDPRLHLFTGALLLSAVLASVVLLSRVPLAETLDALGILGFGVLYFALPASSMHYLQQADPWLVFLLMAIVFLGDTAAYYAGSAWGKHKMAPVVSPKKSWEGSVAGFATSLAAAAVWSQWRLGHVDGKLMLVAAVVTVAAQLGDLVESMIKRGAGVKDSGTILPGHGGVLDRLDAILFATPVLLLGLWLLGVDGVPLPLSPLTP